MGPQHPATHGVLRLEIETDGEIIQACTPHLGFLHRCMEKHAESIEYRAVMPFVDRLDYVSALNQEYAYADTVESLAQIEVPQRAQHLRILLCELNRIASHLLGVGTYCLDLGAFTPFLLAFAEREKLLDIFEEISGARLLYHLIWIGGVWQDLTPKSIRMIEEFLGEFPSKWEEIQTLVTDNVIFQKRTQGVGVIGQQTALDYACTGPVLRAAGVDWDLRVHAPYGVYGEYDVQAATPFQGAPLGDCFQRHWIRMAEMKEAGRLAGLALSRLPDGPTMAKIPKVLKLPVGSIYKRHECPRGELGFFLHSTGAKKASRIKVRSPGLAHISVLPKIAPGMYISDFVSTVGSLDFVMGEVDR